MGRIIGIDLGTTNSCAAIMENGKPVIILNAEGLRTTPSVVAFTKTGERLVGNAAVRQAVTNSERTVHSIKREMGTDYSVKIGDKYYSPPEISAMILQRIKKDSEAYLGEQIYQAVITVPAYFTDAQRQATKDAGKIAGLEVLRIINEPTAAALAYGIDREEPQKVLVYDLGGGTFDVSVLDIKDGVIEVLATAGNNRLGGEDFNQCVVDYFVKEFKRDQKIDLSGNAVAMQRLREAVEQAKIALSSTDSIQVTLPFVSDRRGEPVHMDYTLTRDQFNGLTAHLVQATEGPVRQVLDDARIKSGDIGKVLLVGGSTRIPAVQQKVKSLTGKEGFKGINPDECVAIGAALQGGVLIGLVTGLLLLDVTPLSLGIETLGGMFTRVIDRNTTIPTSKSQIFTTAANFQPSVDVHVLQGERPRAGENKTLGKFKLKGIQMAMRGVPQIEVTFTIDTNGIVNVAAKDLTTGKRQDITVTSSSNMSDWEIQKAIKDAEQYSAEDEAFRREGEAKNRLESLIMQAENSLRSMKKEDKAPLKDAVKTAQKALRGKDLGAITAACETLENSINAEKM